MTETVNVVLNLTKIEMFKLIDLVEDSVMDDNSIDKIVSVLIDAVEECNGND